MNSNTKKTTNDNFCIDKNIAYFIGVLHSDGCIYFFNNKKRNQKNIRLILGVGKKSIPMALKFKKILALYFNREINLRKIPKKDSYVICTSINRIWHIFKEWHKGNIPGNIKDDYLLFGAYLAGLIDGDGHIKIKHNTKDRIIPQCVVRITSDHPLKDVKQLIEKHIGCKSHFVYDRRSKAVETCFYISKKSIDFTKKHIYPHLVMPYKKEKLNEFFEMKK